MCATLPRSGRRCRRPGNRCRAAAAAAAATGAGGSWLCIRRRGRGWEHQSPRPWRALPASAPCRRSAQGAQPDHHPPWGRVRRAGGQRAWGRSERVGGREGRRARGRGGRTGGRRGRRARGRGGRVGLRQQQHHHYHPPSATPTRGRRRGTRQPARPVSRGSHSSTFKLTVSIFSGIGCVASARQ